MIINVEFCILAKWYINVKGVCMNEKKLTATSHDTEKLHDDLLRDLDRESAYRILSGTWNKVITAILLIFSLFQLYVAITGTVPERAKRILLLGFVITVAYWLYPRSSKCDKTKISNVDMALGFVYLGVTLYYMFNYQGLIDRSGSYTTIDIIVAIIGIVLVIEACRRVVGWPIIIIAGVFILYAYFGAWLPGFLNHRGFSVSRIASHLFYTTEGIMGSPIGVTATFICLFILFGAFLEKTGIGQFFIDFANAVAGFAVGGPAKVAVLTSALQGTVTGSSVSNTVSTGSFTIPLMKSMGYSPEFAGAVEAAASTGGQIMPPIMGAAAFLIADAVGVNYFVIAKAAIIPSVLYFMGIWIMVHLEAKKIGLKGLPKDQLPKIKELVFQRGHLVIPLVIIIIMIMTGKTVVYSALFGILSAVVVPYLRKSTRVNPKVMVEALVNGARNVISVACACGVAGIIVGIVTLTGVGLKLGTGLIDLSGGNMLITLFFTMITSIILGMGVPTTANYLITSTIAAPIVMQLGVPALAAHLFVFYFGILADITPPVALAAYAGSAISKGNPFKTGVQATKLVIGAFIIPYIFVLNPALILIDTNIIEVIQIVATSVTGIFGISIAMVGWMYGRVNYFVRIVSFIGGIMLIDPNLVTDIIGVGIVACVVIFQKIHTKKAAIASPHKS